MGGLLPTLSESPLNPNSITQNPTVGVGASPILHLSSPVSHLHVPGMLPEHRLWAAHCSPGKCCLCTGGSSNSSPSLSWLPKLACASKVQPFREEKWLHNGPSLLTSQGEQLLVYPSWTLGTFSEDLLMNK